MIRKYILILMFLFIPVSAFATTFEGVGATSTNSMLSGDVYICTDPDALNFTGTSTEANSCYYTPPTMQELLVINTTIIAFACFIWMSRLFIDVNVRKSKD